MEIVFEVFWAVMLTAVGIIALSFAAVIAYAVFVGIQTYFEEHRKKKEKDE